MNRTFDNFNGYSEEAADDDGNTSYSQSSADSPSENECDPVLKTNTACSPIFPNTNGSQLSPTKSETGSTEDDDDSERSSVEISPFLQASVKGRRRQLISSDSELESVVSHEGRGSEKQFLLKVMNCHWQIITCASSEARHKFRFAPCFFF